MRDAACISNARVQRVIGVYYYLWHSKCVSGVAVLKFVSVFIENSCLFVSMGSFHLLVLIFIFVLQMSDWESRPLSPAQCIYAAQDAHCLLRIYHVLTQESPLPNPPSIQALPIDWTALQVNAMRYKETSLSCTI